MKPSPAQQISDLLPLALRDTASTVVALRSGNPPAPEVVFEDSNAQVAALRDQLQRRGLAVDVIDDALYAQCALLDEAALNGLTGAARDSWEREPLQVRVFGRNDAGEELLRRIDRRLSEDNPVQPLLKIFAAVLRLGFRGRYAMNDSAAREKLIHSIDDCIARAGGTSTDSSVGHQSAPLVINPSPWRLPPLPPVAWVAVAGFAAGLVWFAIDRWLQSSIAGMAH
ncbi:DotU family type IV/VI secretion system protein [Paraburkholderia phenoliruptrix]|uniref:DotU family type IV/VI secretion system protein n=1 Tax=Paraburkholderia phenoliruptrix TaxID=252970 RepID=UPI001C6E80A2|nr:DotU/TssL family secretion system protein [Paraburkholderia phenoliruptrix]MBW9106561.1 DotU family type IV/VI secretion system protein [Paraburkholderia phenoliruptrix]MBW9131759.1 DotU family type IV/VI secretion system protein [Paraburkholderia ginsengiterrae]